MKYIYLLFFNKYNHKSYKSTRNKLKESLMNSIFDDIDELKTLLKTKVKI